MSTKPADARELGRSGQAGVAAELPTLGRHDRRTDKAVEHGGSPHPGRHDHLVCDNSHVVDERDAFPVILNDDPSGALRDDGSKVSSPKPRRSEYSDLPSTCPTSGRKTAPRAGPSSANRRANSSASRTTGSPTPLPPNCSTAQRGCSSTGPSRSSSASSPTPPAARRRPGRTMCRDLLLSTAVPGSHSGRRRA